MTTHIQQEIRKSISQFLSSTGIPDADFAIEYPQDLSHGDIATNVALVVAKASKTDPHSLAKRIVEHLEREKFSAIQEIAIAGPGFINIRFTTDTFVGILHESASSKVMWGGNDYDAGQRVVVEYTDPNPFKEFHIGHLFPNTIGESLSRILEASGANVARVNYQGDVGMHVAKAIWGVMKTHHEMPHEEDDARAKAKFLGKAYATGATAFEADPIGRERITKINKQIYDGSDPLVTALYDNGKRWSLEYFETIYEILGTKFSAYFFESETAPVGKELVQAHMGDIFVESDGAIVFRGEDYGLHTRVFISTEGLPTYEAKELGLAKLKYERFPYDLSVVVTGNEITEYFKVLQKAMELVFPKEQLSQKTHHVAHGMMRLKNGKMSSRTGDVITAIELIESAKDIVRGLISERSGLKEDEKEGVAEEVAVGAIKFAIVRQQVGGDIVFDFDTSLSFDGDSGPYLQYTVARLRSLMEKAETLGVSSVGATAFGDVSELPRVIARFPDVVMRARLSYSPHHIATYILDIARRFNAFYAEVQVLDGAPDQAYKLLIVESVYATLSRGLWMLGIPELPRM